MFDAISLSINSAPLSSSANVKLRYEMCLGIWGNATALSQASFRSGWMFTKPKPKRLKEVGSCCPPRSVYLDITLLDKWFAAGLSGWWHEYRINAMDLPVRCGNVGLAYIHMTI